MWWFSATANLRQILKSFACSPHSLRCRCGKVAHCSFPFCSRQRRRPQRHLRQFTRCAPPATYVEKTTKQNTRTNKVSQRYNENEENEENERRLADATGGATSPKLLHCCTVALRVGKYERSLVVAAYGRTSSCLLDASSNFQESTTHRLKEAGRIRKIHMYARVILLSQKC